MQQAPTALCYAAMSKIRRLSLHTYFYVKYNTHRRDSADILGENYNWQRCQQRRERRGMVVRPRDEDYGSCGASKLRHRWPLATKFNNSRCSRSNTG